MSHVRQIAQLIASHREGRVWCRAGSQGGGRSELDNKAAHVHKKTLAQSPSRKISLLEDGLVLPCVAKLPDRNKKNSFWH